MWSPIELIIKNVISHSDSKYVFKNGVTTLIYGVNLDDDGQGSNGSGKSAFIESISLVITGSPFRNVRDIEIIKNGEKEAELEMIFENKLIKSKMRILRKFYANSKSSECSVWINDKLQAYLTSVKESNKFILDQFDISREDLINYFIIAKGAYTSFFATSDTKKKELISRFSNADSIVKVEPLIQTDIDTINSKIGALTSYNTALEAKKEVYREQLEEVDIELAKKEKEDYIKELEEKQSSFLKNATECYEKINKEKKPEIAKINKEIKLINVDDLKKKKVDLDNENDELILKIKELSITLSKIPLSFKKQLDKSLEDKKISENALKETKKDRSDLEDFVSELEKTIKGAVECPKCSHKFSIGDKDMDINECIKSLKESKKLIAETDEVILEMNDIILETDNSIEEIKSNIIKKEDKVNKEIKDLKQKQNQVLRESDSIGVELRELIKNKSSLENNLNILENSIKTLMSSAEEWKNRSDGILEEIVAEQEREIVDQTIEIQGKINEIDKKIEETSIELEAKRIELANLDEWFMNFKRFRSFLANKSIASIGGFTNMYLEKLKSNLQVSIEGYKTLANGKLKEEITTQIMKNGVECGSFDKLSGGEKVRVEVCLILALQRLINLNSKTGGINLCIMDEILESLDSKGLEGIIGALENINNTIMLITHGKVEGSYENLVVVQKKCGNSTLI